MKKNSSLLTKKLKIKSRNNIVKTGHLFLKVTKLMARSKKIFNRIKINKKQRMNLFEVKI